MDQSETIISSRPDREIRKKIIKPGDYTLVPYEDSRCKITLSDISCRNHAGECSVEADSRVFSANFDGTILIGDSDNFIDRDIELLLLQMCSGEIAETVMTYRDHEGKLAMEISCTVELNDAMEEQVVSDWGWERLHEAALHHKERGVELVKLKKIVDAFRRFNKALKFLIAIEPIDPELVPEDRVNEMIQLKVKLYNNLAHCQLQFDEFEAALELCNIALKFDGHNVKAIYRRCLAFTGLHLYEEAWSDIQKVLELDPSDKLAQQKAGLLRPKIDKINTEYTNVIKKMFV